MIREGWFPGLQITYQLGNSRSLCFFTDSSAGQQDLIRIGTKQGHSSDWRQLPFAGGSAGHWLRDSHTCLQLCHRPGRQLQAGRFPDDGLSERHHAAVPGHWCDESVFPAENPTEMKHFSYEKIYMNIILLYEYSPETLSHSRERMKEQPAGTASYFCFRQVEFG